MKIYILTVSKERCFGNGTKIVIDDVYLGAYKGFEIAKDAIYDNMRDANDFRRVSANEHRIASEIVYTERYEDRYSVGDSDTYYIREVGFAVPELKENEDLKKTVKSLEKKIDDLKTRLNSLTGSKATYKEEVIKPKKEEKSNVRFDW